MKKKNKSKKNKENEIKTLKQAYKFYTIKIAKKILGIDRKNILRWRNQQEDLVASINNNKFLLSGSGRKIYLSMKKKLR